MMRGSSSNTEIGVRVGKNIILSLKTGIIACAKFGVNGFV
jgi:hypothetical protein